MKSKGQPITVEQKKYTKADLEPRSFKDHNDLIVRVPKRYNPNHEVLQQKPPGPKQPVVRPTGPRQTRP